MNKKVAVITRTKNRPIMLPRVLDSISGQTFKDLEWVIVNDAGKKAPVEEIAAEAAKRNLAVRLIHRDVSTGMEAASNAGIRASTSRYVVIHDDDDTWEAGFLEATVEYLEANSAVPGVITWSNRVDEVIEDGQVKICAVSPYNHWLLNIYLADMAVENRFPPISFLFRRATYDHVGAFNEGLPVLGDWDFNLRVLMSGDIHVIPQALANYHFRAPGAGIGAYGNTVTAGIDKHILYDAVYRNQQLREDIANGSPGLGMLLGIGQMLRRVNSMSDSLARWGDMSRRSRVLSIARRVLKI